jgi:hypothetical protein
MAISLPFSVTIKSSVQMMQKLATAMAMQRMTNVAIFSSLSALNRFLFISSSRARAARRGLVRVRGDGPAIAAGTIAAPIVLVTRSGSATRMSMLVILMPILEAEELLRVLR